MTRPKSNLLIFLLILAFSGQKCLAQTYATGLSFDDTAYMHVLKKAVLTRGIDNSIPERASIKEFAPIPKHQGPFSTCTAWACAYCARTMVDAIRLNWKDKDSITAHAYSPAFLFRLLSPADNSCNSTTNIDLAFQLMKTKGNIRYSSLPLQCGSSIDVGRFGNPLEGRLKDYARLFDLTSSGNFKVQAVKKSISEKKPVVIAMICPPSFEHAYNYWQPTEQPSQAYNGHAMCVVSYDDTLYNGGAFEIQNSWGENWGNGGYVWIRYNDFVRFVKYGFELIDIPEGKPHEADLSGSIKLLLSTGLEMPVRLVSKAGETDTANKHTHGPLIVYHTDRPYKSGTLYRCYISNNEPAYVYAIGYDLTNTSTPLFPYDDGISAALTYKSNDVPIPDESQYIQFDTTPGEDFLCVIYSKNELNINDLVKQINAGSGTINERLYKILSERVVDPANIKFDNEKISFTGYSGGKDLIAMIVAMDHK